MKTIFLLAALFFTGCNDKSFNTVKYYKGHPQKRYKRIKECSAALKMTATQKQDCQNANVASRVSAKDIDLTRHYGEGW